MGVSKYMWCWGGVLMFVLVGCGPPDMCKVSGVVTRKGKPVPFVEITFSPEDPELGRPPIGIADKDGKYSMSSGSFESVIRGKYTIHIDDPQRVGGGKTSDDPDFVHVTKRYAAGKSDLKIDVDKNMTNYEIKLDD